MVIGEWKVQIGMGPPASSDGDSPATSVSILLPAATNFCHTIFLSDCVLSTEQRGDCFSVVGHFERAAGG